VEKVSVLLARFQGFIVSRFQRPKGSEAEIAPGGYCGSLLSRIAGLAKSQTLAVHTYPATANFPRAETYGLTSQIRRASVSVVSNIAEGQGRLTAGEFRHFLGQARGSLPEAETQMAIALDLGFVGQETYAKRQHDLKRLHFETLKL
jgi:four helix bundle protein